MEEPGPYPCAASAADMLEALLVWRRDVRHFLARPIPENEMERLFALAQLAPSVGNAQPWRYLRFRSAFVRGALADHVDEAARQAVQTFEIGRTHVWTPVTTAHLVCRLLLEQKPAPHTSTPQYQNHI